MIHAKNKRYRNYYILVVIFLLFKCPAIGLGETFYIAPESEGKDSYEGTSEKPFATFSHAFSKMEGGNTLYVKDGVYNQQIKGMPSGDPDNYTKIYAVNDHVPDIDGKETIPSNGWEALLYIKDKSYVEIRGLRVHHSGPNCYVLGISGSDHINVRISGFWQASNDKYHAPVNISNSSYILLEDVWAFGRGRYTVVLGAGATKCTLRRVVTRWGEGAWPGEPISGFSTYKGYDNLIENCITIDHNLHPDWHTAGHAGFYNISWNSSYPESRNNRYLGCIALNMPSAQGFSNETQAQPDDDNNIFENCIAAYCSRGIGNYKTSRKTEIKNFTSVRNTGHGIFNSAGSVGTILENSLAIENGKNGVWNNYGDISASYLAAYDNDGGNFSGISPLNSMIVDPELKYLPRIEDGSPVDNAVDANTDIGANVTKRYVDGVLTGENLWPWPFENWIKEDMRTLSKRGFCADGKQLNSMDEITLTSYVWEYLDNPIPPEIYGNSGLPSCTITGPTSDAAYENGAQSNITLSGTASDDMGVTRVTWENRATGEFGEASGTHSWTAANIPLAEGDNLIVITASDADSNVGEDRITARYTQESVADTGDLGSSGSGTGNGDSSSGGCFIHSVGQSTALSLLN